VRGARAEVLVPYLSFLVENEFRERAEEMSFECGVFPCLAPLTSGL
jgi:hypothetical protein